VVEKENKIQVMRFGGQWVDIGSWNTLTEAMSENTVGDARIDEACSNVHIINELDVPILAMGLKDVVISASPDGILVADKDRSGYLKKYVEDRDREAMFAEKSWGSFRAIDAEKDCLVIKVVIKSGDFMNYHSHEFRDEVWVVVSGTGKTVVDGIEQHVSTGDVITMKARCKHTIIAETELKLVEVQIGQEITVHDKRKYPLNILR
jgi:mannose-1-phosphate guanylyltransferase